MPKYDVYASGDFIKTVEARTKQSAISKVKNSVDTRFMFRPRWKAVNVDTGYGPSMGYPASKKNPSMKMPKLGKWISAAKVRLVKKNGVKVLEIRRTVKKRTTRTNKARKRKPATRTNRTRRNGNGYVVYPENTGHHSLSAANKAAKAQSKRHSEARVENIDTQKTMSRWVDGRRR